MGIIKVLRLGEIESYLKEVTSLSLEIKLFEEEYGTSWSRWPRALRA